MRASVHVYVCAYAWKDVDKRERGGGVFKERGVADDGKSMCTT